MKNRIIKNIVVLILVLSLPVLAACGSAKAEPVQQAKEVPASAQPQALASAIIPAAPTQELVQQEIPMEPEDPYADQPFLHVGIPAQQVRDMLGEPNKTETGANNHFVYYNYNYRGMEFSSIDVNVSPDGRVYLIVLVADNVTDKSVVQAFTKDWADALSKDNGAAAFSSFDTPSFRDSYDWNEEVLTLDNYDGGTSYHIGIFWKLY